MNSVWVCQQQSQTSHLRPDCDYEPESTSSFCLPMGLQLESPSHIWTHLCPALSSASFTCISWLELVWRLPLHKDSCTFPMVDNAAVKHPLSLAVTEPREATAHTDPSGKDKARGSSNRLKIFLLKY